MGKLASGNSRESQIGASGTSAGDLWAASLPIGLFLVSERGRILYANLALRNVLNLGEGQLHQQSYHTLFRAITRQAKSPDVVAQALDTAVLSLKNNPMVHLTLRGNPEQQLEICLFPTAPVEGTPSAWGGIVQDRSSEVERLTADHDLIERLLKESRKQLAAMQGQLRALSSHHQDWDEDMVNDLFSTLESSGDKISGQVEHILDLLRLSREGLVVYPRQAQLAPLVEDVAKRSAVQTPDLKVEFSQEEELPYLRVDPTRVKEALRALIRFLASVGGSPRPVTIRGTAVGNRVEISVQARYPAGSPATSGEHPPDRLAFSRNVIQAHGGRFWVEDQEEGKEHVVTIFFTLPVMPIQREVRIQEKKRSQQSGDPGTILVADADREQLSLLTSVLRERGYQVLAAADGPAIIDITQASTPDLILLEWDLPGMNGISATKYIRRWSSIPIFMVTTRTNPENLLDAFEAGVDDFLTKPFLIDEVLARIAALLRREHQVPVQSDEEVFEQRGLRINFDAQRVWKNGQEVDLTPTEYKILTYMVEHRRQVLPYQQLIEHAWEATEKGSRRGLFVHISRLRDKVEEDPNHPELIVTRWGVGYIFMPE